ncbi:MAG: SDR family oxidoreductase [Bacteroidales bacterium]|nr:SDR family oxidoreductase [Bacteroidales bacterium]
MKEKTILITGATDGIGKETARQIAETGAYTIVHGRNKERLKAAVQEIKQSTGNDSIDSIVADFSSLQNVRQMAAEVQDRYDHLDVLLNNAGVSMREYKETAEGFEMTFGVNHLAHFLLNNLLLPLLRSSAPARIVTVSSMVHKWGSLDFDNLNAEKGFYGIEAYSLSKLCNALFAAELAERLKGTGVTSNYLHPGVIGTKLLRAGSPGARGDELAKGAVTSVYLATSPQVENITGKYFDNKHETAPAREVHDKEKRKKLWELSEKWCGLT